MKEIKRNSAIQILFLFLVWLIFFIFIRKDIPQMKQFKDFFPFIIVLFLVTLVRILYRVSNGIQKVSWDRMILVIKYIDKEKILIKEIEDVKRTMLKGVYKIIMKDGRELKIDLSTFFRHYCFLEDIKTKIFLSQGT